MGGKKSWCFLQLLLAVRPIKMLFPASLGSGSMPAVLCCSWRLWGHAFISVKCKAEAVEQDGRRDFSQRSVGAQPKGGCHLITVGFGSAAATVTQSTTESWLQLVVFFLVLSSPVSVPHACSSGRTYIVLYPLI